MKLLGGDPLPVPGTSGGSPSRDLDRFLPPRSRQALWVDSGRSALCLALTDLRRRGIRRAWLPFLCCSSVVEPFLDLSFSLSFYGQGGPEDRPFWLAPPKGFAPSPDEALLFIHYFGFLNEGMTAFLGSLPPSSRPRVIEDAVGASLTEGTGQWGHYTIKSFRKFLPVADGALLAAVEPLLPGGPLPEPPDLIRADLKGRSALGRLLAPETGRVWLRLAQEGEERFDGTIRRPAPTSLNRLGDLDVGFYGRARRDHFLFLAEAASMKSPLIPLATLLPEGTVPLGLPALTGRSRDETLRRLRQAGIFCPVDWGVNALAPDGLDATRELARRLLVLPVDPALTEEDLSFLLALATGGRKEPCHSRE